LKFVYAIQDIQAAQAFFEKRGETLVKRWQSKSGNLTAEVHEHAAQVLKSWWLLGDQLMAKYADGYVTIPAGDHDVSTPSGYPAWWLAAVGYPAGPPPL